MLHEPCKQELSDWPPQALFAIGTFGNNNNNLKEDSGNNNRRSNSTTTAEDSSSFQDFTQVFYLEEVVNNLQNEAEHEENQTNNDIINERLNSSEHSRLELEVKDENGSFSDGNFYPRNNLVYNRGRDRCLDSSKSGVSKKSLSFLLKKMFVCSSGFPTTPLLKDPHPLSTESRMEKVEEFCYYFLFSFIIFVFNYKTVILFLIYFMFVRICTEIIKITFFFSVFCISI